MDNIIYNFKLKNIDLASNTIMGTAINVMISLIFSIVFTIAISIIGGFTVSLSILTLIPTFICSTLLCSIANIFLGTYLYNSLSKKIKEIGFSIENTEIKSIEVIPTASIIAAIATILSIIVSLIAIFIIPLIASVFIQSMYMSGEIQIASMLYQVLMIVSNPITMIISWIATLIGSFLVVAICTTIYNNLTERLHGIQISFRKEEENSYINYIEPNKTATIISVISAVIGLIFGIIVALSTQEFLLIFIFMISGFIMSFVLILISAYLYNYLAPKLGQIKLELEKI